MNLLPKALHSLDESYQEAERQPVPKSAHLRLTLAVLSTFSSDREPMDAFWKYATNPAISENLSHEYGRSQILRSAYLRIYRAVGVEPPD